VYHARRASIGSRAEDNFELVERLAEREERDRTYFGRRRHEREKKLRDPQDVLIEADRLRQPLKKRREQRRETPQQ
jgi:chromatin segregation and condensation protein Rec8/ScpA/Scc1 (kleisin family)